MRRCVGVLLVVGAVLGLSACAGRTSGASKITDYTVTLHATARCDTGEVCRWYWEWWPAGTPRLRGRDWPGSEKTPVQGPVNGPTGEQKLSTNVIVSSGTTYWWVFCGSPDNGATYVCAGPHGTFSSPRADPPPDYATFTSAPLRTLAERWNGSAWTIQRTPKPSPLTAASALSAVSCTSATACTAVGTVGGQTLAEGWDGTSWTIHPTPTSPSSASNLLDVSCTSPIACTAVGMSPGGHAPLAERWDGTSWTVQPTPNPNPTGADSFLQSVSCTPGTACTAVGVSIAYATANPPDQVTALAEAWNGTAWTIQSTPDPGGSGSLRGVSCTSAASCTAVGHGGSGVLAERWDGVSWTTEGTANPGQFGDLSSVSCTSATACTAVGSYYNGTSFVTLAERWNGTTWTILATPSPGAYNNLSSVSCSSATACTAVGTAGNQTLAEHWDGSTWTIQPTPSLNPRYSLSGVSCTSATACTAVGQH